MAVEGDLVLVKGGKPLTAWETRPDDGNKNKNKENASSLYSGGPTGDSSGAAAGGGRGGRGGDRDGHEEQGGGRGGGGKEEVVRVTAETARAGVFTIKHVVLPLPGVCCCADYMCARACPPSLRHDLAGIDCYMVARFFYPLVLVLFFFPLRPSLLLRLSSYGFAVVFVLRSLAFVE